MKRTLRALPRFGAMVLILALGGLLIAACGGDDDDAPGDGSDAPGDFASGSDEDYVTAMCETQATFQDDLFAAIASLDPDAGEDEAIEAFIEPFRDYVDAARDVPVPDDIREYHSNVVDALSELVDGLEDGNTDILEQEEPFDIPEPPQEVQDRLAAVAADIEACADIELFGE